jgi:hypothetical protein
MPKIILFTVLKKTFATVALGIPLKGQSHAKGFKKIYLHSYCSEKIEFLNMKKRHSRKNYHQKAGQDGFPSVSMFIMLFLDCN